jgi:hypothetical protein
MTDRCGHNGCDTNRRPHAEGARRFHRALCGRQPPCYLSQVTERSVDCALTVKFFNSTVRVLPAMLDFMMSMDRLLESINGLPVYPLGTVNPTNVDIPAGRLTRRMDCGSPYAEIGDAGITPAGEWTGTGVDAIALAPPMRVRPSAPITVSAAMPEALRRRTVDFVFNSSLLSARPLVRELLSQAADVTPVLARATLLPPGRRPRLARPSGRKTIRVGPRRQNSEPAYTSVGRTWRAGPDERVGILADLLCNYDNLVPYAAERGVRLALEPLNPHEPRGAFVS